MVAEMVTETFINKDGEILWYANYPFSKLVPKGSTFSHEGFRYVIISTVLDGSNIRTVVSKLS